MSILMRSTQPAPPENEKLYQAVTRWGTLSWEPVTFVKDVGVRDLDQVEMSCQSSIAAK